jgi:RNA polymerase sigma-70 factor (ECF subfamily)
MNTTSVSLLEQMRQQPDDRSWQRLVDIYQPWLHTRLRGYGLDAADADDLAQDVMAVLLKEIAVFQHNGRKGAFRAWLRGVIVNRLREHWRERKREMVAGGSDFEAVLDQLADDHNPASAIWDREHDQHVVQQLLRMIAADFDPRTWQAFRAFVLEERSAATVASELGMSQGAVWTAKSRVLTRLRQAAKELLD